MDWIQKHFTESEGFQRPDWDAIYGCVDKDHSEKDQQELWCDIARIWLEKLKTGFTKDYALHESNNFILLTAEKEKYVTLFTSFLEKSRKTILNTLPGIVADEGFGKHVVIIFDDIDDYYSYLSYYYPEEGEFGLSAGVFLNKGYGHFAFPFQEIVEAEPIAAHELTHALLSHLTIPAWLNEGIAVNMEGHISGCTPYNLNAEMIARHKKFWGIEEVQGFWAGESFGRPDEGQELSYNLAQFAVSALIQNYDSFVQFANKAHYSDGGEAAANNVYEGSLGGLLTNVLGEDDWSPKPELWDAEKVEQDILL